MQAICVVAACAPRLRIPIRALRCSAAPSIWPACAPNLSPIPSAMLLLGRLAQGGFDDLDVLADLVRRALGNLLAVVADADALRDAHHDLHVVLDQEHGSPTGPDLLDELHQLDLF